MHIKLLYNKRQLETKQLKYVSVSTQTDPTIFEDSVEDISQNPTEELPDYSFITDKTTKKSMRILEHPAPSNHHHSEYRMCHPNNPRTRIQRTTFCNLKEALNHWQPDDVPQTGNAWVHPLPCTQTFLSYLLLPTENISHIKPILICKQKWDTCLPSEYCLKIALFNTQDQEFILRTAHQSEESSTGWTIDCSTILAYKPFWIELKKIINSI